MQATPRGGWISLASRCNLEDHGIGLATARPRKDDCVVVVQNGFPLFGVECCDRRSESQSSLSISPKPTSVLNSCERVANVSRRCDAFKALGESLSKMTLPDPLDTTQQIRARFPSSVAADALSWNRPLAELLGSDFPRKRRTSRPAPRRVTG